MGYEIELIEVIARQIAGEKWIADKDLLRLEHVNWGRFKDLVIYHELAPFAYPLLKDFDHFLPQDIKELLRSNYYLVIARSQNFSQEFLRMSDICEREGIKLVPIKGAGLLGDVYSNRPFRPMADIDVLIKEADFSRIEQVFSNSGYVKELCGLTQAYWMQNQCHIVFRRTQDGSNPILVEVHWALDFKRKQRLILPGLWDRIRQLPVDNRMISLLSPEDTLFSLALHNRRFGKMLCLKYACDGALVLSKYAKTFDWDYVLKESKNGKMCSAIFFFLSQIRSLFPGFDIPDNVWHGLAVGRWKRQATGNLIKKDTFSIPSGRGLKKLYLKIHFLLYDSIWEPVEYILNIPLEQFARFYGLKPYESRTILFYRTRLLYMLYKLIVNG